MKHFTKLPWLLFISTLLSFSSFAQTTEDFEGDVIGATTFDDNGQNFTITNGSGETNYDIETFAGGGWNGTGADNNFVDNSGTPVPTLGNGSSFTVSTTNGTDIFVNRLYLFMSQFNLSAASGFTLTIQGRKNGSLVYTIVKSSGFSNTSTFTPNNGFTHINFATEGGSDNSNTAVDELVFTTTGNADYIALDGMNWEFAPACAEPSIPTVTSTSPICAGGSATLTIGGSLNDATQWHIYTGFCGVTQIGTTTGTTFDVTPASTTSYFIRGEGGCATPGTCGAINITVNSVENANFTYSASAYCANDSDPSPTITGVTGGTFTSTAGLILNASTGVIDLSASTLGTYSVTYTTPGTCQGTSNQTVTINAVDNASFNYSAAAYCVNATDPTPTITGLGGGTFSSTAGLSINPSTGTVDVSTSTPGTYTITYTTAGTCPNSSSVSLTVNALDDASFSYAASAYCASDADPTPTITGLGGGSFSSTAGLSVNASTGVIDLSVSTPGTYSVTYTTTGLCPNSSSVSVTVNALDNASFNYSAASYCSAETDPTPTITGLGGGTFSSTAGLSINAGTGVIDLSTSTPGTYSVTYTTAGACPNSSSVSITVTSLDNASFNYSAASYCQGQADPTPTITGVAGGTFTSSPAGLSINPSTGFVNIVSSLAGTYTVTYTTTGTCSNSSNVSLTIATPPAAPTVVTPVSGCPGSAVTLTATGSGTGNIIFYNNVPTLLGTVSMPPATATFTTGSLAAGTYTFLATESNGGCESFPTSITVEMTDATAPTAVCQDITLFLDGTGSASLVAADIDGGSTDDCGPVTFSASQTTFDCSNLFASPANNLVITGAYDGPLTGGAPKGIELYVLADIADLSEYGVGSANNGGGTDGEEFTFPAVAVTAGTFIYVATESTQFTNFFGFAPDYITGSMGINGDDAVELFHQGVVIDVFGDISVSGSGEPWDYLDGWASRNTGTGPDGTVFSLPSWSFSGINALDNESTNATAVTPFPVATYSFVAAAGPTPVTLTVTDGSGNASTCIANVTVTDSTAPVVTCPGDQTETPDASCNFTLPDYTSLVTATDNCGAPTLVQSPVAGTVVSGNTTITMTGTDASGNAATCTFDVILSDLTPPTAVCQDVTVYLDGTGSATIVAADIDGGSTDNCAGLTLSASSTSFTCAEIGANNVTLTATDGNGNSSTCNAVVTVLDTIAPVAVCQNITVFLDGSGNAIVFSSDIDGGSTDNCSVAGLSSSPALFTCADIGANSVTLTVTDAVGNSSTCTSVVTIVDSISPTTVCQNINVYLDGAGNASLVAADIDGGSTDNCGPVTLSASTTAFTCANLGPNNVTLTGTDADLNSSTCTAVVTVIDTISPTAVCQNIDVYLDGAGSATIVAADIDGGSTDNCGPVSLIASLTTFTCTELGSNSVTLTVNDGSANSSTCTAIVTVIDTIAPTVACPGNQLETPDASCNFTLPDYTSLVSASDNCGTSTITQSPAAGTVIGGTTTLTMTAVDGNGNTSTCTFDVVLNDLTAPTAVCQNIDVYLDAAGNATIVAADIDGGSTDNCAGLTLSASQTAFTCANIGPNNVTLIATDGNANTSNCVAVVTVLDTISPVVTCPGDQAEVATTNCDFTMPDYTALASATDNCSAIVTITQSPIAGTVITADQVVTISGVDAEGNIGTCTFNVTLDYAACVGAECTNAIALAPLDPCGDQTTETGSTVGGTTSTETSFCGTSSGSGGANWYTFTGDGGTWTASTLDAATNYDTKLWIYEGLCGSLNCVTGNDDFASTPQSQVSFVTTAGATYYVVVGGFSANEGNYLLTVSNVESIAPIADLATLPDVTAECEVTSLTAPTATDNCAATVAVTNDVTLPITAQGTTVVTWTYDDGNGNTSTQTQNVVLTDVTAPVPDVATLADITAECEVTTLTDPTATDNCSGTVTVTNDAVLPISGQGTSVITWTYTDANGNATTQTQNVVIDDVSGPTPDVATLSDITAECEVTTLTEPTATDNCGGAVTVTNDAVLPISTQGTTVVSWTYSDVFGNSTVQTQNVVITDVTDPVPDSTSLEDISSSCSVDLDAPTATDNCAGVITATTTTTFPIENSTTVVWEFNDGNGNIVTQNQSVVITNINVAVTLESDGVTITASNPGGSGVSFNWLDCNSGFGAIPGATSQSYTATTGGGSYAVRIVENGCADTSVCITVTSVGLEPLTLDRLTVYPNPSQDGYFTVNYDGTIQAIDVVDMLGRVIELPTDLSTGTVDGSELAYGRYMVRVTTDKSILTTEIVIAR